MSQLNFSVVTVALQPKPLRQNIHSIFPYPLIFKGNMFPRECTFFLFHFIISLRFKDTTDTVKPLCPAKFTIWFSQCHAAKNQRERQKSNRFYLQNNNFVLASRFFSTFLCRHYRLLENFQEVSRNFSKRVSCSIVTQKTKNFFWSDGKIWKLFNKSKISEHFCAILRRNQRC